MNRCATSRLLAAVAGVGLVASCGADTRPATTSQDGVPILSVADVDVAAWDGLVTVYFLALAQAPGFLHGSFCDGFVNDAQLARFEDRLTGTAPEHLPTDFHVVAQNDLEHPRFEGTVDGRVVSVTLTLRDPLTMGKACIADIAVDDQYVNLFDPRTA